MIDVTHPTIQKWFNDGRIRVQCTFEDANAALYAFNCGPGWYDIIDRLLTDLFHLGWNGQVFQVKEKFGGLRFYIGEGTEEIFNRIDQAEKESLVTCEHCGEEGSAGGNGFWIKTLCPKHMELYKQGRLIWAKND